MKQLRITVMLEANRKFQEVRQITFAIIFLCSR